MHPMRPAVLLLSFAAPLLLARGVQTRIANAETSDEQGASRAVNVMVLIGIGHTINIHHAKVAHADAP